MWWVKKTHFLEIRRYGKVIFVHQTNRHLVGGIFMCYYERIFSMTRVLEAGMKKCALFLGIIGLLVFSSCASAPVDTSPIDRGNYPKGVSGTPSVTLYIHENVQVLSLDKNPVNWENTDQRRQFVNIGPGPREFTIRYNDGKLWSPEVLLPASLTGGSYLLKAAITEERIRFAVVSYADKVEGKEVSFYLTPYLIQ
jgi:hypothetical protein